VEASTYFNLWQACLIDEVEVKVGAETAHAPVSIGDVNNKC
jgi:hypothetical protein